METKSISVKVHYKLNLSRKNGDTLINIFVISRHSLAL